MFKIEIEVPQELIAGHLCTAMEEACGYWARTRNEYDGVDFDHEHDYLEPYYFKYFNGGWTEFGILNDNGEVEGTYSLDRISIKKGLKVMAEKHPHHLGDFVSEDGDAITADVFLQCCLFAEVIFG